MKIRRKLKDLSLITQALIAIVLLVTFAVAGCSSTDKVDPGTPEGAYKLAEEYEKDERYEEAVGKYNDVKNKHPYSRFAVMAELKVGDVHFLREAYIEAQYAYQTFKELHPKHPRIDYVTFRLGLSYFNQLPSTIDRDLSLADKAILYFDEVVSSHPKSEHVKEATEKRAEARRMQGEKELYIAGFYMKKKQFDSALGRYEGFLKSFTDVRELTPAALLGAARSAKETGDREKIVRYVKAIRTNHPQSDEANSAQSEFSDVR